MQRRSDVCRTLFEWILKNKWECQSPCPFVELYEEFGGPAHIKSSSLRNGVVGALLQRQLITGFTIYQEIHLNFILNVPLNSTLQNKAKKFGTLKQENGYIIEFISNDGHFRRLGTPFPRYENQNKAQGKTGYWQGTEDNCEPSGNAVTTGYEETTPNRQALNQQDTFQRRRTLNDPPTSAPPSKKLKDQGFPETQTLLTPKIEEDIHDIPQVIPVTQPETIPTKLVLVQLLNLIRMIKSPSLDALKTKISQKLNTSGMQDTEVSMEDFESDVEHGLKLLFRKASTEVKSESMNFLKFLNLFGFVILNVGFSDDASIVVKINKGIEENERSTGVKLIAMENVDFIITSLLLTTQ